MHRAHDWARLWPYTPHPYPSKTDASSLWRDKTAGSFIVLGFLIALGGQLVRSAIDDRVKTLRTEAERTRRLTPPSFTVSLRLGDRADQALLTVAALNDIPFNAHWVVVTTEDRVLSGVMLADERFVPNDSRKKWAYKVGISPTEIRDGFLEFRFRWESQYWAELGNPPALKGSITQRYRLQDGQLESLE